MGAVIKDNNHLGTVLKARPGTGSQLRALKVAVILNRVGNALLLKMAVWMGDFMDKRELPRAM